MAAIAAATFSAVAGRTPGRPRIENGRLIRPTAPGLGLTLTPDMEARYPFDETAVYSCVLTDWGPPPDSYWRDRAS